MESQMPFILQNGVNSIIGLQGLNPLGTISGIGTTELPNTRGRGKLAREEALLEAKVVQIIVAGDPQTLKPNTGRSVAVGDHHICVAFRDDTNSGYRIWEWHGHILMFDYENGYIPEFIYGNFYQLLPKNVDGFGNVVNGVGLSGAITNREKAMSVVHRNGQK
ncbi:hypothetical protein GOP47_0016109 [Adiantum capillus-veneris]|uniref:Uncharacterized protein n=1 Tax=Adiantum capillus-veneris TaxID=13818 RepID=A0A9D4UKW8_ADICA|nr:hypothetical protein GOP47_0015716 [Adiantum capillus-veneris]KAI5069764.1 hypothetical protein GOP47_0016065 [Adiantum capillus-veneris]KAI5069808.1 hypothetical protein GOP47_0016109 [Adiantum capillus-veneris]